MLLHSSLELPVQRMMRVARQRVPQPQRRPASVCIDVVVPAATSSEARRALHDAFGPALGLYIVTTDKAKDSVAFRIEVASHTLDEVLAAVTRALPAATLGRSRAARTTPPSLVDRI
ncbi:MAG TPA: hypothetical protein VGZ01_05240 [Trinickia sp.]|jgi:hypothetical protein|nr:hypothetical protein [Trinickia sp.]